jgi:type IV pilus assembly protein PilW
MRKPLKFESGSSLIEVMISMTLALFVIGALVAVFVSTSRSYHQDQMQSRMQSNARFALKTLVEELSMSGFFGHEAVDVSTTTALILNSDCGGGSGAWALDTANSIAVSHNVSAATAHATYSCIEQSKFSPGTDIFSIKRVAGKPLSRLVADSGDYGDNFYRTGYSTNGQLLQYDGTSILDGTSFDWEYSASIYYIRNESLINSNDGIPTLYRKSLDKLDIVETDGGIARGIERFRIIFGIDSEAIDANPDTKPDGTPNYFTSNPSTIEFTAITSARIFVLARSTQELTSYVKNKSYVLGDITVTDFNDGYYRKVFSTTVAIRNPALRSIIKSFLPS